jgi:hypothetical protein
MLRLRHNLPFRMYGNLAVISALLLLIFFVAGNGDPMFGSDRPLNLPVSARQELPEPAQKSLPEAQTAAHQGFRISLMIFR